MAEQLSQSATLADRNHFLIRRLHSLTGIIPIGVFVCFHLLANLTIVFGPEHFQTTVQRIHLLEPYLEIVEVVFIFIPIVFHALLGIQIWLSGQSNTLQYRYGGNVCYTLQRWSGGIVLVFIFFHVFQLHWIGRAFYGGWGVFELGDASDPLAAGTTAQAIQSALWVAPVYFVGVLAAVFHLANGIRTALMTWGIAIGVKSQALWARACIILGLALGVIGVASLSVFRTMDVSSPASPPPTQQHTVNMDDGAAPHS